MLFQKGGISFISVSDGHVGSTLGLHPKVAVLDKGDDHLPSPEQKWLSDCWDAFWKNVRSVAKKRVWLLLNSDLFDRDTNNSFETWSKNPNDLWRAGREVYKPGIEMADRIFLTKGTAYHVGSSAWLEEKFGEDIGTEKSKDTDKYSSYEWLINVDGVIINAAHKGPMGRLEWTRGNALNRLAIELQLAAIKAGEPVPHFAIRAHNHKYGTSDDGVRPFVFGQPCWQLKTEYAYNRGIVELSDIGGLILQCENGKCEWEKRIYKPEGRVPWSE